MQDHPREQSVGVDAIVMFALHCLFVVILLVLSPVVYLLLGCPRRNPMTPCWSDEMKQRVLSGLPVDSKGRTASGHVVSLDTGLVAVELPSRLSRALRYRVSTADATVASTDLLTLCVLEPAVRDALAKANKPLVDGGAYAAGLRHGTFVAAISDGSGRKAVAKLAMLAVAAVEPLSDVVVHDTIPTTCQRCAGPSAHPTCSPAPAGSCLARRATERVLGDPDRAWQVATLRAMVEAGGLMTFATLRVALGISRDHPNRRLARLAAIIRGDDFPTDVHAEPSVGGLSIAATGTCGGLCVAEV